MLDRTKYLLLATVVPIIFGTLRFVVNRGNYHKHEFLYIVICTAFLSICVHYFKRMGILSFNKITKKQWVQIIICLIFDILWLFIFTSLFNISSGSSTYFSDQKEAGYSISLILSLILFGPVEEELTCRVLLQKGVFRNSLTGLMIVSSLFSILHEPNDFASFISYAVGGLIYGVSYKLSDNFLSPILCHMGYNSFILLLSLL